MTTKELMQSLSACCREHNCVGCAYFGYKVNSDGYGCVNALIEEALSSLKAHAEELEDERYRHDRLQDFEVAESQELAKVKAERDAAIADIKLAWLCAACKKRVVGREWLFCLHRKFEEQADCTLTCGNFEWRGVMQNE